MSAGAFTVDVRQTRREVEANLARLGAPGGASKVLQMAINKVLPSVRATAAKVLLKEMGVPPKFTRSAMRIRKANRRYLSGALLADVKQTPLINFKARQTNKGVTYQVGTQPRQLMAHAYINKGNSTGARNVFKRVRVDSRFASAGAAISAAQAGGDFFARMTDAGSGSGLVGRYPTFIKYGPSVARELALEIAQTAMRATGRERWDIEIERALKQYLRGQGFAVDG